MDNCGPWSLGCLLRFITRSTPAFDPFRPPPPAAKNIRHCAMTHPTRKTVLRASAPAADGEERHQVSYPAAPAHPASRSGSRISPFLRFQYASIKPWLPEPARPGRAGTLSRLQSKKTGKGWIAPVGVYFVRPCCSERAGPSFMVEQRAVFGARARFFWPPSAGSWTARRGLPGSASTNSRIPSARIAAITIHNCTEASPKGFNPRPKPIAADQAGFLWPHRRL